MSPLPDDPSVAAVRVVAMNMLARREHGARELCAKLEAKDISRQCAAEVVAELSREGLQSDQRFVDAWVRSRISKGKGPMVVRAELAQRGVDDGLVEQGLQQSETDWAALAGEVRRRKYGEAVPEAFEQRAKQSQFLQRRGFTSGQIREAMKG